MTVYWTSDTHYGHRNIIDYSGRPYRTADGHPDVDKMNEDLICRWNARVQPEDTVWHLGDFGMGDKKLHKGYFDRLNGKKHLIRGNHDQSEQKMLQMGWLTAAPYLYMELDGKQLYLQHVPSTHPDPYNRALPGEFTNTPHPGTYDIWLCGHIHEKWCRRGKIINVGVDQWNYEPVTLEELLTAKDPS